MAGNKNQTFVATPMKIRAGSPSNVRTALTQIETGIKNHRPDTEITAEEQTALWTNLSEWCSQNLAALEGTQKTAGAIG